MSWMDSWSRPSKSQATPAPYYLLPNGHLTPYCHSCGRVIGARKVKSANTTAGNNDNRKTTTATPVKYCSSRCKGKKVGVIDKEVERMWVRFLSGRGSDDDDNDGGAASVETNKKKMSSSSAGKQKMKKTTTKYIKGDPRILVSCSVVEEAMFGNHHHDQDDDGPASSSSPLSTRPNSPTPQQESGENNNKNNDVPHISHPNSNPESGLQSAPAIQEINPSLSIRSGTRVRPAQSESFVNGSVGGEKGRGEKIEETDEMLEKRREGQRRAKEREMVRCAARRGVVFGFLMDGASAGAGADVEQRRLCEAVMGGKVVEPSFAKGDWGIRWRE